MFNKRGWPAESIRSIQLQGAVRGVGSCLTAAAASRALAGAGSSLARVLRGVRRGLRGLGLLCPSCGSSVFQRPAGPSWAVPRACALALVRRRAHRCAARMRDQRQHDGCDAEPPSSDGLGFSDLGRHPFREPPPSLSAQELAIQAGPLVITAKKVRRKVVAESVAALYLHNARQREALPCHGNVFFYFVFYSGRCRFRNPAQF